MRRLIEKLFRKKKQTEQSEEEERGKYMPAPKIPTDENFMLNFKENGGKFLYCDSQEDLRKNFKYILEENNWFGQESLCYDPNLIDTFKEFNVDFGTHNDTAFFLGRCEYLVANTGAILVCSEQIREKKLKELPLDFIIVAGTSQLIDTIGEGLQGIKSKNKTSIPTNITTLKTFQDHKEEKGDFLTYGSPSKNLYLLLLEDL